MLKRKADTTRESLTKLDSIRESLQLNVKEKGRYHLTVQEKA